MQPLVPVITGGFLGNQFHCYFPMHTTPPITSFISSVVGDGAVAMINLLYCIIQSRYSVAVIAADAVTDRYNDERKPRNYSISLYS